MRNRVFAIALSDRVLLGGLTGCGAGGGKRRDESADCRVRALMRVVNVMPDAGRMTSFLSSSVFSSQASTAKRRCWRRRWSDST